MTEPYYQDDAVVLYNADCRDLLPGLTADVLITDPPYGVELKAKKLHRAAPYQAPAYRDDPEYVLGLIAEVIPMALTATRSALIFPGATMLFDYPRPAAIGSVFNPSGGGCCSWGFQCTHLILYYGPDPYLADRKGSRPNSFKDVQGQRAERFGHPCPKPLKWMEWAVDRASRPGETVLDPFAGSGTTLVAAKRLGRKAIGIEIDEAYCEIAVKRLAQGSFFEAAS